MLRYYSARLLAHKLHIPLNRWKRWAREFLPPDPLGGLQSGYARQYSLQDAFTVYLGGYLVSRLGFAIPESRRILDDLKDFLHQSLRNGAGQGSESRGLVCGPPRERTEIAIFAASETSAPLHQRFAYRARIYQPRAELPRKETPHWQVQYEERLLGEPATPAKDAYPALGKILGLSEVCDWFMALMGA